MNMLASPFGIACAFGPPRNRRTWSGAPAGVADGLERRGASIVGIETTLGRIHHACFAGAHLLFGYGQVGSSEAIARGPAMRWFRARNLAKELLRQGISRVLHTGTLDLLPAADQRPTRHYLLCDHTWNLCIRYRPDRANFKERELDLIEDAEKAAYAGCEHIFTFGEYVRSDLISHYGVPADRVTAVGSGMGSIRPYAGPKNYENGRLLFIAKHYFFEKGGPLLLDAFQIARRKRPDLKLTIVGNARAQDKKDAVAPNVEIRPYVAWSELESLLREAALLVQPMLNDPWGQVYLEAMLSRTPVIGLNRNGLPEITQQGHLGFLVDEACPEALAATILDALAEPGRLATMGLLGQDHVLRSYSWDRVAEKIWAVTEGKMAAGLLGVGVGTSIPTAEVGPAGATVPAQ